MIVVKPLTGDIPTLPFLKNKQAGSAGVMMKYRQPDESKEENSSEDSEVDALRACASDLIKAVGANDEKGVAEALKSAFEICEAYPHKEAEQPNEQE